MSAVFFYGYGGLLIYPKTATLNIMIEIYSRSKKETQKIAKILAGEVADNPPILPIIFAMQGELGSGKTTFAQAFARALGVKEKILSPTFVLMRTYEIKHKKIKNLIHFDCYRLQKSAELLSLGLQNFFKQENAIILIEWADRVKNLLPINTVWIRFEHGKSPSERTIILDF